MKLSTNTEQKRTAIVVDDDHDTVEVFSDLLQILQIRVIGKGYDGRQAVELYQKLRPALVILDVYMPKYDGVYALEKIREINPSAKVMRSEERRVGKECTSWCRYRWSPDH